MALPRWTLTQTTGRTPCGYGGKTAAPGRKL